MPTPMSRRSFLTAGAGAVVLAACGSSGKGSSASTTTTAKASSSSASPYNLIFFTPPDGVAVGAPQRFMLGVRDADGALVTKIPPQVQVTLTDLNGNAVGAATTGVAHGTSIPVPYIRAELTFPKAGDYYIRSQIEGVDVAAPVTITGTSPVPAAGQPMIPFDTPTTANLQGVELLCTRQPACPLHDVSLRDALAQQQPVAFLIATPQFCQTAICGPVLDVLLAARDQFPHVTYVHSEVYPTTAAAKSASALVPVINAYKLTWEPALFLAKPDGTIAERLDTIFDAVELHDALTRLVS